MNGDKFLDALLKTILTLVVMFFILLVIATVLTNIYWLPFWFFLFLAFTYFYRTSKE